MWVGMELSKYMLLNKGLFYYIQTKIENTNVTGIQIIYSDRSHLSEFLSLSLTDRWVDDMHLQMGQLSCRDLQWKL